jgi:hypothetical protein
MPTLDAIYKQEQAKIGRFIAQFDKDIQGMFEKVKRISTAKLAGLSTDDILKYEFIWRESLKEAGYYAFVNDLIDKQFDGIYSGVLKTFEAGGLKTAFTTEDATKIQILKQMKRDYFIRLGDDVGLTVKRELFKYAIADASVDDMAVGIANTLKGSNLAKYATTYANTAILNFYQEIIDLKAKGLDGVWVYEGIKDARTRDFCRHVLNKRKYYDGSDKSRIASDDDRAYNCRHQFVFIDEDVAIADGYKKNK